VGWPVRRGIQLIRQDLLADQRGRPGSTIGRRAAKAVIGGLGSLLSGHEDGVGIRDVGWGGFQLLQREDSGDAGTEPKTRQRLAAALDGAVEVQPVNVVGAAPNRPQHLEQVSLIFEGFEQPEEVALADSERYCERVVEILVVEGNPANALRKLGHRVVLRGVVELRYGWLMVLGFAVSL